MIDHVSQPRKALRRRRRCTRRRRPRSAGPHTPRAQSIPRKSINRHRLHNRMRQLRARQWPSPGTTPGHAGQPCRAGRQAPLRHRPLFVHRQGRPSSRPHSSARHQRPLRPLLIRPRWHLHSPPHPGWPTPRRSFSASSRSAKRLQLLWLRAWPTLWAARRCRSRRAWGTRRWQLRGRALSESTGGRLNVPGSPAKVLWTRPEQGGSFAEKSECRLLPWSQCRSSMRCLCVPQ